MRKIALLVTTLSMLLTGCQYEPNHLDVRMPSDASVSSFCGERAKKMALYRTQDGRKAADTPEMKFFIEHLATYECQVAYHAGIAAAFDWVAKSH